MASSVAVGWLIIGLLAALRVVRSPGLVIFLLVAIAVGVGLIREMAYRWPTNDPLRGMGKSVLLLLVVLMPCVFDSTLSQTFELAKYSIAVLGATVLFALWLLRSIWSLKLELPRTALNLPVVALLVWTAVATFTSSNIRVSVLGEYGTYDGLYLTLAFVIVFEAVVFNLRPSDLLATVRTCYLFAGGIVALYGMMQFIDRLNSAFRLDWVKWTPIQFSTVTIWATFGNPNHLAGFLVTLVPLGLVLLILTVDWRTRIFYGLILVGSVLELIETGSRGAWVAIVIALVCFAILVVSQSQRKGLTATIAGVSGIGLIAAAAGLFSTSTYLRQKLNNAFRTTGTDNLSQRIELVKSAARMANHSPVVGMGPDSFQALFPQYETTKELAAYGADPVVNGPHNVFASYLVSGGYVGLALWCTLLVVALLVFAVAWRRLGGNEPVVSMKRQRIVLAGIASSLLCWVLQECFDAFEVGVGFEFWLLLGLLALSARGAGVSSTLRLALSGKREANEDEYAEHYYLDATPAPLSQLRRWLRIRRTRTHAGRDRRRRNELLLRGGIALVLLTVGVSFLIAGELGPMRADHDFAYFEQNQQSTGTRDQAALAIAAATSENPWEPIYSASYGDFLENFVNAASDTASSQQIEQAAKTELSRSVELASDDGSFLSGLASYDLVLYRTNHDERLRMQAISLLERAMKDDPLDTSYPTQLTEARKLR